MGLTGEQEEGTGRPSPYLSIYLCNTQCLPSNAFHTADAHSHISPFFPKHSITPSPSPFIIHQCNANRFINRNRGTDQSQISLFACLPPPRRHPRCFWPRAPNLLLRHLGVLHLGARKKKEKKKSHPPMHCAPQLTSLLSSQPIFNPPEFPGPDCAVSFSFFFSFPFLTAWGTY